MQYSSTSSWRRWAPFLCAAWLAACGGGDGGGGSPVGTTAGEITLYAGSLQEKGSADGIGAAAQFNEPVDVALDSAGNAYVADRLNHTIRKVTPGGVVTTLAGTPGVAGAADGAAAQASFSSPAGVAVNAQGDVFVADTDNHVIRRISTAGVVSTAAGAAGVAGAVDGPAATARFNAPHDLAFDPQGNLYIAERSGAIRRLRSDGIVTTFAGAFEASATTIGDGMAARFSTVAGVAVDAAGVVYVAERNATSGYVRRFDAGGRAVAWGAADAYLVEVPGVADISAAGAGELVAAASEVVPVVPSFTIVRNSISRITAAGTVVAVAGQDAMGSFGQVDGVGLAARFQLPQGLALGPNGRIVVADTGNHAIRAIDSQGNVGTLAGGLGIGKVDGPALQARFFDPIDIEASADGTLFVADLRNAAVRRISPAGTVSTMDFGIAPPTRFGFGLTVAPDGTLYLRGSGCVSCSDLYVVPPGGAPQRIGDLFSARALAPAPGGGVYYVDDTTLYRVAPDGRVTTIASGFNVPQDLAVDAAGVVYVAEFGGHTVRAVGAAGAVRLVAGRPGQAGAADGPAADSRLNNPRALAADAAGNVYVADATTVRRIGTDGQVRSIAGSASQVLAGSPLVRAAARVKRLTWHGGYLYATVDNAVIRIAVAN